jgi:hypothetical protein
MSAPYIRTGRGGAGNHIPAEEARSEDLEAAKEGGVANAMAADQMMEATPGEYKHTFVHLPIPIHNLPLPNLPLPLSVFSPTTHPT